MESLTGHPAKEVVGTDRQWIAFYSNPRPTMADLIIDDLQEEIVKLYEHKCRKSPLIEGAYEAEDFFPGKGETGKRFFPAALIKGDIDNARDTDCDDLPGYLVDLHEGCGNSERICYAYYLSWRSSVRLCDFRRQAI